MDEDATLLARCLKAETEVLPQSVLYATNARHSKDPEGATRCPSINEVTVGYRDVAQQGERKVGRDCSLSKPFRAQTMYNRRGGVDGYELSGVKDAQGHFYPAAMISRT